MKEKKKQEEAAKEEQNAFGELAKHDLLLPDFNNDFGVTKRQKTELS